MAGDEDGGGFVFSFVNLREVNGMGWNGNGIIPLGLTILFRPWPSAWTVPGRQAER
jgi:hypothetical protein